MAETRVIKAKDENEAWKVISADLNNQNLFSYRAQIEQGELTIELLIDIDPGGGFESGYSITSFTAPLAANDFRFVIHKEHFIDELGKFLGMEDTVIGYPEFDKSFIIKTNNAALTKSVFADEGTRKVLLSLNDFTLGVIQDGDMEHNPVLQLSIQDAITDPSILQVIYHSFYSILFAINHISS